VCDFRQLPSIRDRRHAQNETRDAAKERGEPTFEQTEVEDRIFTWPDLVFSEFICMVVLTVVLVVWSILLKAPLEDPANPALAPNPSKAPWYFLGLQEMLVYFDPWLAGVLLPGLIIVGLMAIPYIDTNPKGNGYFTFRERKVEISIFLFGWLILWSQMIVIGTFLRGPNWNFFGPYEFWDITKVDPLTNVDLSEYFWIKALGIGLPHSWLLRELPGILIIAAYFLVLPVILARGKSLAFRAWSPDDRMMLGPLGILEPSPAATELVPDIMLVPLAAFDRAGHRIGYGAGHYDYTLAHLRKAKAIVAIGLAFAAQEVDAVPALPHDVALDYVLTDKQVFDFRS